MRTITVLIILFFSSNFQLRAQETEKKDKNLAPSSIYFTTIEIEYANFYTEFRNQLDSFNFQFLKFNEDRLEANLPNPLYFKAFTQKPTKYYLDTYKKVYDLKGQRATFFNIEKLYEVPSHYSNYKRNK